MRENQVMTGYWYSMKPKQVGVFVGGSGIFQIYETKPEAGWRAVEFNLAVVQWRIDSIRFGKAIYPCPCTKMI